MPLAHRLANTGTLLTTTYFDENSQFGSGSLFFDGTTGYLKNTTAGAFNFGTGDFTIEYRLFTSTASSTYVHHCGSATTADGFACGINAGVLYGTTQTIGYSTGVAPLLNQWNHIAWVRSGTTVKCYLNGSSIYTVTISTNFTETGFTIGAYGSGLYFMSAGYLSNIRVVKGTALYTANFTPPTIASTAVANTVLLLPTYNYNPFKDYSSNNNTITVNGTVTSNTLTPFSKSPRYTANNIIGLLDEVKTFQSSLRFDGSTGYLLGNKGPTLTGDFTIEMWVNGSATRGIYPVLLSRNATYTATNNMYLCYRHTNAPNVFSLHRNPSSPILTGTTTLTDGVWYHFAVVRSGSTVKMYVNGNQETNTLTDSSTWNYDAPAIGSNPSDGSATVAQLAFGGNISNLRILNGTALYTANFTPPTTILSAVANTKLLLPTYSYNPFVDYTSNNVTLTVTGGVTANTLTPTITGPKFSLSNTGIMTINGSGQFDEYTLASSLYSAGLYKTTYVGYFSDTPTWFATATRGAYGANPATEVQTTIIQEPASDDGSNFSVQWLGYFLPSTTETYTFFTSSDDGSYMWIGANALTGFTTGNATVSNGGAHAPVEVSGTAALTAGVYYPIRIQFGEIGGGDVMSFNFSTATITKTTNVTGRVFYNPATNGF